MEALRKAEEAKRKSQEQEPQQPLQTESESDTSASVGDDNLSASAFTLEPREDIPTLTQQEPAPPPVPAPQSEDYQASPEPKDELHEYFADDNEDEATSHPPPTPRGRLPTRDQQAAAAVFAAKQNTGKKSTHIKILLASGISIVCIGAATLWFLSDLSTGSSNINPAIANFDLASRGLLDDQSTIEPPAVNIQTSTTTAAVTELVPDLATVTENVEAELPTTTVAIQQTPVITEATANVATVTAAPVPTLATVSDQAVADSDEAEAENTNSILKVSRTSGRKTVNSTLQSAYNAVQDGDNAGAIALYQQTLMQIPNNRDALIGLASLYARMGEAATARQLYLRLLKLNPQDAYARTGLLQTTQNNGNPAYESELKALLSSYPDVAPLHFALGNFYAANQRWSEAQPAYFDALLNANRSNSGPVSPDYAFNLAVSLEQLQQPGAALNYYRQAQELAMNSTPGFDQNLLRSRLAFLELNQP